MEKFLEIYNDADDKYVLISASNLSFIDTNVAQTETFIYYDVNATNSDIIKISHSAGSNFNIQNAIVNAVFEISKLPYTTSSIKVNLPVEVTSIELS